MQMYSVVCFIGESPLEFLCLKREKKVKTGGFFFVYIKDLVKGNQLQENGALWVVCTAFLQQGSLFLARHLFVWCSEPKASSVFTLCWHVWQKLVNSNYPTLAEHDCWINRNTSCSADELWMLIGCLEVLQSPIPWQQPMEMNCTRVEINSSLFLCRETDGFWLQHMWCTVKAFQFPALSFQSTVRYGKPHFWKPCPKRGKTASMNLKDGEKKQARFDKLVWTLLTVKPLIYGWTNLHVFSLDA